jgi:hypothetical protein
MGVQLFDSLLAQGCLVQRDRAVHLTRAGRSFATALGIPIEDLSAARSVLCRECLDWSERRSHLAGSLGRALLARFVELGWARVDRATRVVAFTPAGLREFASLFGERLAA